MNLNKKIRCGIAAALVLALLCSAFIALPAAKSGSSGDDRTGFGEELAQLLMQKAADSGSSAVSPVSATPDEATEATDPTEPATDPIVDAPTDPTEEATAEATDAPTDAPADASTDAPTDAATQPETDAPTAPIADDGTVEPTDEATEEVTEEPTVDPDYVGAVTGITRTDPGEGVINLQWSAVDNAQGYHIYWRSPDADSDRYALLSSVKDTSLTIRNLKKGSMFYFKVAAYRAKDGDLIDGESAVLKAGTTPVGVSSFYLASGVSTGTLLRWSKNDLCDGYILYRQFDGKWSRYKTLDRNTTEFRDTDVIPGRAYNYRLSTYRTDERGELESSYLTVKTICGLCAPADRGTTTVLRKMYFKWVKNPYAHGYEVRYSSDNKNFTVLADTTGNYYTSNRFIEGKHYYFRIYPYHYLDNKTVKIYGTYWAKDLVMTNSAYGKTVPSTYIEVNINQQHMWYYINGELYVSTDVVTGNYNSMDTPKGYWEVNSKASPCTLVGDGYVSYVDYWMAFIGSGYGIHDASWRSEYGGSIFKGNGSHGCINTPYAAVKKMYAKVTIGTPVIVY